MATEKWIAGATAGWASAFGSEINGMANGSSVLSTVSISNSALDVFADFSITAGGIVTTVAPARLGVYVMPLNQDGSVYGDGVNTTTASAYIPPTTYFVGNIAVRAAASTLISGTLLGIIIPSGAFKFVLLNDAGVGMHATQTAKYRTYNRSIA